MTTQETLKKVHLRRQLFSMRLDRECSQEQLRELHALEEELSGIDVVGVMFDEIFKLDQQLKEANRNISEIMGTSKIHTTDCLMTVGDSIESCTCWVKRTNEYCNKWGIE